jgi:hypothetical protein
MCGREIGSNCSCKAFIIRDLVFEADETSDSRLAFGLRVGCGGGVLEMGMVRQGKMSDIWHVTLYDRAY